MALRWADPFDHYGGDEAAMLNGTFAWAQVDTHTFNLSSANPRTGAWAFRMDPGGVNLFNYARRVVGDSLAEVKVGYGIYVDQLPTSETTNELADNGGGRVELISFRDATNSVHLTFVLGTNGQIALYRGFAYDGSVGYKLVTFIDRSDPTILVPARAYSHLEFKVGIHSSAGYVEVRLNGVTMMNLTGINTQSGAAECSQVALGCITRGAITFIDFDDMVLSDALGAYNTGFVGDKKVYWLAPTADTAQEDFTPSTGSDSYALLDEAPPNDADYISTTASTAVTRVECANLAGSVASVAGVFSMLRAKKDDAGICDMKPGIRSGSTDDSGAGQPITTTFGYYAQVFEDDPVSGVPFTPSEVNALQQKIERSA